MQDVTRSSSSDDIGGDVVMTDDADENRAEHPSSSGSDSRRRITTKKEPREVRDAQTSHRATRSKKNDATRTRIWCHHARGIGRIPRENNEGRERSMGTQHDALRL